MLRHRTIHGARRIVPPFTPDIRPGPDKTGDSRSKGAILLGFVNRVMAETGAEFELMGTKVGRGPINKDKNASMTDRKRYIIRSRVAEWRDRQCLCISAWLSRVAKTGQFQSAQLMRSRGSGNTSPLRLEFVIASGVHPLLLGW